MVELYNNKEDCCACGACLNICPKDAISMKEDESGFVYPSVNNALCIGCGMCKKVCAFQNIKENNIPLKTWAAATRDEEKLKKSASGGVFYTLASETVKSGGNAVGAAFDENFNVKHIIVKNAEKLKKLQGSKYSQSSTGMIFREIKQRLVNNEEVLFSGCPCQVAGLKAYLGRKYDNLITIDLICHGVPSNKAFKDYLRTLEEKKRICVKKFNFRDKEYGWGKNGSIISDKRKKYKLLEISESYFYYFAKSVILRENCYKCKYACSNRPGDITIGDYWGVEKEHPEILKKQCINESNGVSVIIANTSKGMDLIERNKSRFKIYDSTFEKAARANIRLRKSGSIPLEREKVLTLFTEKGWKAVDDDFNQKVGLKKYIGYFKLYIPKGLKRQLKKLLR